MSHLTRAPAFSLLHGSRGAGSSSSLGNSCSQHHGAKGSVASPISSIRRLSTVRSCQSRSQRSSCPISSRSNGGNGASSCPPIPFSSSTFDAAPRCFGRISSLRLLHPVKVNSRADAARVPPTRPGFRAFGALVTNHPSFENHDDLAEEDLMQLQQTSLRIMQDPRCELTPKDLERCLRRNKEPPPSYGRFIKERDYKKFFTRLWQHINLHRRDDFAVFYTEMITGRLLDKRIMEKFELNPDSFNHQIYFLALHMWLLHQRFVLEGKKMHRIEHNVFENCWTIVKFMLVLKQVPEYRFEQELKHVQSYMFGCMVTLDQCLERADILPARMQQALWRNVYSGEVPKNSDGLILLTKYMLRQLSLVLQLEEGHFVNAQFVWADFDEIKGWLQPGIAPKPDANAGMGL